MSQHRFFSIKSIVTFLFLFTVIQFGSTSNVKADAEGERFLDLITRTPMGDVDWQAVNLDRPLVITGHSNQGDRLSFVIFRDGKSSFGQNLVAHYVVDEFGTKSVQSGTARLGLIEYGETAQGTPTTELIITFTGSLTLPYQPTIDTSDFAFYIKREGDRNALTLKSALPAPAFEAARGRIFEDNATSRTPLFDPDGAILLNPTEVLFDHLFHGVVKELLPDPCAVYAPPKS
jgi:hypothetical protein